jgi:hypothetical protein
MFCKYLLYGGALGVAITLGVSGTSFAQPLNDDFDFATNVLSIPFTDSISTLEATTADDDPDCFGSGPTVWYSFTPTEDLRIRATTFESDYDTTLSVYTGDRGSLGQTACNDDDASLQSRVDFDALAGTTYYFMVGAFGSGPGGSLVFNVAVAPPLPSLPTVTIDPRGLFDRVNQTARISGTADCEGETYVVLYPSLSQLKGRFLAQGQGWTGFVCSGLVDWSVDIPSFTGISFAGGPAKLHLEGYAHSPSSGEFIGYLESSDERITLRSGK